MNLPGGQRRLSDGTLATLLKQVPATPTPTVPREPTLIEAIVADLWEGGTGHDSELTDHLTER